MENHISLWRNMMKHVLFAALMAVSAWGGLLANGQNDEDGVDTFTMKLSHGDNENNPTHLGALRFKELVEEYSGGGIRVQIYPNNQLGSEQEVAQALREGAIEAEILYTGNLQPFSPSVGVLMLPYLFTSSDQVWKAFGNIQEPLNERMVKEAGVRAVGWFEKGFRVLTNSKKPVRKIDDLQGLKIRTSKTAVAVETFKSWGIDPVPMAWAEVFTALQQNVIDGQENPYTTAVSSKFFEVQKYITEIHYLIWSGPIIVSEKFYQSLPPEYRDAVNRAGAESAAYEWELSAEMTRTAMDELVDLGMVLLGPPEDEDVWQERSQATWEQLYDSFGGEEWVREAVEIMTR